VRESEVFWEERREVVFDGGKQSERDSDAVAFFERRPRMSRVDFGGVLEGLI